MWLPKTCNADELRAMAVALMQLADEIDSAVNINTTNENSKGSMKREVLNKNANKFVVEARNIYRFRRDRKRLFPSDIFGEPAWDILLDLFIARVEHKNISVSSACIAADVPSTTGLRWLKQLEHLGLVSRLENNSDLRVTWIQITDLGFERMLSLFEPIFPPIQSKRSAILHTVDSKEGI